MCTVHHGTGCNGGLTAALLALAGLACFEDIVRAAAAFGADEAIGESLGKQETAAGFFCRKPRPKRLECNLIGLCHMKHLSFP